MGDGIVLGEQEGLAHGDRLGDVQWFDVQVAIVPDVVLVHGSGGRIAGKDGADLATFQVQVVFGDVAPVQSEFQTVHVDGQWSHGKNGSF
ncbi:hypothetical protein ABW53_15885 [Stutzerimonas stutzeri]|nr:hypothetical protein ABW53_15885 [Stutzerimonas stutzeri]